MENIAQDRAFTGTVLLSFAPYNLTKSDAVDDANSWVERYEQSHSNSHAPPFYFRFEHWLKKGLDSHFSFTKDGGKPLDLLTKAEMNRYTYMDGERRAYADFTLIDTAALHQTRLKDYIGIPPFVRSHQNWLQNMLPRLLTAIENIQRRGGRVIVFRFPSDREIW